MPLSSESKYGVRPLTEAINNLPVMPTIIRQSGLFVPESLTTTYVDVEAKDNILTLVQSAPRGSVGSPTKQLRGDIKTFKTVHLPKDDIVRADDVQNVRAFGTENKTQAVNELVLDKAEAMKNDIEYTREHLQLGAIQGKVVDADGAVIYDFNQIFGITRPAYSFALSNAKTDVGKLVDDMLIKQSLNLGGDVSQGFIAFCSPEFLLAFQHHPTIKDLYTQFADSVKTYREGDVHVAFRYRNIEFVLYTHKFGSDVDIQVGEAHLVPKGVKKLLKEYFAPADMNATVNTKALPYYASREKLPHDKGWSLHAQSNVLPVALRPKALATLRMS